MIKKCTTICTIIISTVCGLVADAPAMRPYRPAYPSYIRPTGPMGPRRGTKDPYTFSEKLSPLHEKIFSRVFDENQREFAMRLTDFIMREGPDAQEEHDLAVEIVLQLARHPETALEPDASDEMSQRLLTPTPHPPRNTPSRKKVMP